MCVERLIDRGAIQGPVNSSLYLDAKYSTLIGIWSSSRCLALAKGRHGVAFTRIRRFLVPSPGLALLSDSTRAVHAFGSLLCCWKQRYLCHGVFAPSQINACLEGEHFFLPGLCNAFSLKMYSELENSYRLFWLFY